MDSSHQILQPPEQLCLACQLQSLEMHPTAMRETGKLGRKGKAAGNMHYLKCCRMRDRCWHGICGVESHPAHAASWQASLVSNPQLCKTHRHSWHPGWQSCQGPAIMVTGMFLLCHCTSTLHHSTGRKADCTCLGHTHGISLSRALSASPGPKFA